MKGRVYWGVIALCLIVSGYQALEYQREQRWLARKAQGIVDAAHAQSREEWIKALQGYIRLHVEDRGAPVEERPFLRPTAKEVLVTGKGFCGEATRAFVSLARQLGIRAQRVNLIGRPGRLGGHVVAETELAPGRWVLVDVQGNPLTHAYLDPQWRQLDEAMADKASPFADYSNVNLDRLPIFNLFVQRIKLNTGWVSWALENPPFMKSFSFAGLAALLASLWALDGILLRVYAARLGLGLPLARSTANPGYSRTSSRIIRE